MSRRQRGGKKQPINIGDITINDFANATVSTRRPKKTHINTILEELKIEVDDNKSWDENPEEYDGEFVQTENDDGTISYVIAKVKEKVNVKKKVEKELNEVYYELPIDIWFVIGKFIKPEDVGRFAGICKASYSVVCGAKFWIDLYRKYYKSNISLPDDLKPDHLNRKFGVRTLTVRTLFWTYQPFITRIQRPLRNHPKDCLMKRKCTLMWHLKKRKNWSFYFKLEELGVTHQERYKNANLIEKLDDVFVNPDENSKILLVNSLTFTNIPPVQNYVLYDVNVSLSNDLIQQRLKLRFSSNILSYCGRQYGDGSSNVELTIGNVISYKVIDWWHPDYPKTSTLDIFLNGD